MIQTNSYSRNIHLITFGMKLKGKVIEHRPEDQEVVNSKETYMDIDRAAEIFEKLKSCIFVFSDSVNTREYFKWSWKFIDPDPNEFAKSYTKAFRKFKGNPTFEEFLMIFNLRLV